MKNKKNNASQKIRLVFIITLILIFILNSYTSFAWLERITEIENKTVISDFSLIGKVYFIKGETDDNELSLSEILKQTPYNTVDQTMIRVNLTDSNSENYIGNLRVVLEYNGMSPVYIRAAILEQWSENDEFIENYATPYNVPKTNNEIFAYSSAIKNNIIPSYKPDLTGVQQGTDWFDNRKNDFFYYYNAPVYPNEKASSVSMLVVNGISKENISKMGNLRENVELNILIKAEAVQPNRYREFFDLEKLPWE
ncbi:MAG: hypothetical protein RR549_01405 [Oscillospiraceae bacterium]